MTSKFVIFTALWYEIVFQQVLIIISQYLKAAMAALYLIQLRFKVIYCLFKSPNMLMACLLFFICRTEIYPLM